MSIEIITLLMFGSLIVLLCSGLSIGFATGSLGVIFSIFLWGPESLYLLPTRVLGWINNSVLIAIPMFVFMALMLSTSKVLDKLFLAVLHWGGGLRGGLALMTIFVGTIMASMVGVIGAAEVTMGLVALPAMLKHNYDKSLACGCICAGGSLGYLIPPSILSVVYGLMSGVSVGRLYLGGIGPGLILAVLFMAYVAIRAYVKPEDAPALPLSERSKVTLLEKIKMLTSLIAPVLLIVGVLGSIYGGLASVTESSAIGAIGSLICNIVYKQFTWKNLQHVVYNTIKVSSMIIWLIIGSSVFVSVYTGVGGLEFAKNFIAALPFGKWGVLILMQLFLIFLGCFLDWAGILMLTLPIFQPVIISLGFDPLWFGVLFNMNMQLAQLSPPFGMALFYLKGVAPKEVKIVDIYKGVWPFVLLQLTGLVLCMVFPQIITWLPGFFRG